MTDEVREARRLARVEIGATLVWPLIIGFLWVATPGGFGQMSHQRPWYNDALPWIAWGVYLVGLAWMIRIYRTSHLEPEPTGWRYRDS
jgi:hypothetical protein